MLQLLGFLLGLGWALYAYGGAETKELFRFLLILLIPLLLLIAVDWQPPSAASRGDFVLWVWGVFLLFQVTVSNTLEARGYSLFALGWIAFWGVKELARTDGGRRWVLLALIGAGLLEGLTGLVQVVSPQAAGPSGGGVATGTLYNQNHFAGLQNMFFCIGIGVLLAVCLRADRVLQATSERLAQSWIAALACSLLGIPVILSRSRAGSLILVLCLILAYALVRMDRSRGGDRGGKIPLLFVVGLTLGLGSLLGLDALIRRFGTADSGFHSRLEVYRDVLGLIRDHPLLGVGPMNFEWSFRPYQSAVGRIWYDYAHNDYLQMIAEWGVPLGLALWAFVIWRFLRSVQLFWGLEAPWDRSAALGCALAIFSILLHSLIDFNLYIPANHVVFCSILGLSWSLETCESGAAKAVV